MSLQCSACRSLSTKRNRTKLEVPRSGGGRWKRTKRRERFAVRAGSWKHTVLGVYRIIEANRRCCTAKLHSAASTLNVTTSCSNHAELYKHCYFTGKNVVSALYHPLSFIIYAMWHLRTAGKHCCVDPRVTSRLHLRRIHLYRHRSVYPANTY